MKGRLLPGVLLLSCALTAAALAGCAERTSARLHFPQHSPDSAATRSARHTDAPALFLAGGRVSPAYEQWLTRESMLHQARRLAGTVSEGGRMWMHAAATKNPDVLGEAAPTWLAVDCAALGIAGPRARKTAGWASHAAAYGFTGLWMANAGEDDAIWTGERSSGPLSPGPVALSPGNGSAKEDEAACSAVEGAGLQPGAPLVPAATGLGPDFMLEARASTMHKGLYVLEEVPQGLWKVLPPAKDEWDCHVLNDNAAATLAGAGILPSGLAQDGPGAQRYSAGQRQRSVWAATGPVRGCDGVTRRLVYRSLAGPWRPILFWQNPSGLARTLMSGSATQVTGMGGNALAGISLAGLVGLDASPRESAPEGNPLPETASSSYPAPNALSDLTAQVHRCGGWSLLLDEPGIAPLSTAPGCDFVSRTETAALVWQAMRTQDASQLAEHLRALSAGGIPEARLAHGLHPEGTVSKEHTRAAQLEGELEGKIPRSTGHVPGQNAASTPRKPEKEDPGPPHAKKDTEKAGRELRTQKAGDREELAYALHAMLAVPAGLPGLCFLPAEDVTGLMERGNMHSCRYPLDESIRRATSPALLLKDVLDVRKTLKASRGRIVACETPSPGTFLLLTALPRGGLLGTAVNFSSRQADSAIVIPEPFRVDSLRLLTDASAGSVHAAGRRLGVSLKPRRAVHFLVGVPAVR